MPTRTIYNKKLLDAQSMASSITSPWADLSTIDNYSISAFWTGSPVGEFKIQVANDENDPHDVPESIIEVNGADKALYSEAFANYDKVRVIYTATSGSGNLTVQINGKGLAS